MASRAATPSFFKSEALALFRHGMGGLLDCPLYSDGKVDQAATDRRDELADQVYEAAKAMLHLSIAASGRRGRARCVPDQAAARGIPRLLRDRPPFPLTWGRGGQRGQQTIS